MKPFLKCWHRFGSVFLRLVSDRYIAGHKVTTMVKLSAGDALTLGAELMRLAERAEKTLHKPKLKVRG